MKNSDTASPERQYNTRLGMKLFVVYLVFYLVFVLINAFAAGLMETIIVAGLNLAIVYGFGLIVAALVLALVYGAMCRSEADESAEPGGGDAADERDAADGGSVE